MCDHTKKVLEKCLFLIIYLIFYKAPQLKCEESSNFHLGKVEK